MSVSQDDLTAIRGAMASLPADVSSDAHGAQVPTLDEMYAPETHAAALDPTAPVVQGARGTGKSFWAGVLGDADLRSAAATAYPRLGLNRLAVQFGYTGLPGPEGLGREKLDACVPPEASLDAARVFWWATVLRAVERSAERAAGSLGEFVEVAADIERREGILSEHAQALQRRGATLLVVYDALDTVAVSWPRRRLLTQALLEVVWEMRAWRAIRPKLFLRPDQLEDDALRFVELPKLRTGAVRLTWNATDLYGLLFARLSQGEAAAPFGRLLRSLDLPEATRDQILARQWTPGHDAEVQRRLMTALAGPYMAAGTNGHKKGSTYDWPVKHLGDAFLEVTPRSFLGLAIGAAMHGQAPAGRVVTPEGIRHGLRRASKTRVDQLHLEFPWIKGGARASFGPPAASGGGGGVQGLGACEDRRQGAPGGAESRRADAVPCERAPGREGLVSGARTHRGHVPPQGRPPGHAGLVPRGGETSEEGRHCAAVMTPLSTCRCA